MQEVEVQAATTVLRAEAVASAVEELVRHKTMLLSAELQIPAAAVDRQAAVVQATE